MVTALARSASLRNWRRKPCSITVSDKEASDSTPAGWYAKSASAQKPWTEVTSMKARRLSMPQPSSKLTWRPKGNPAADTGSGAGPAGAAAGAGSGWAGSSPLILEIRVLIFVRKLSISLSRGSPDSTFSTSPRKKSMDWNTTSNNAGRFSSDTTDMVPSRMMKNISSIRWATVARE